MTKISDILYFSKDSFFDGAVQSDWFYSDEMRKRAAKSFIFHGPRYHAVSQNDIVSNHKLIDTASFSNIIVNKTCEDIDSSRFLLTIAGYGAGKSHLAVTLASLLSGVDKKLNIEILYNIEQADISISESINKHISKDNFVIVMNGMNDFNLNFEILKNARKSLKLYGLDDDILKDMSIPYKIAEKFLTETFEAFYDSYNSLAINSHKYCDYSRKDLKSILFENLRVDTVAFEIVNEVYKEKTGNYIKWEEGISAGIILDKLYKYLIEEKKLFKSIIIMFDEFGRYLEYAAANPNMAGESAIQQIFECVQNCKPYMIFVGFIQSDLSAYLSRVSNQNLIRYVSRFETSDKYYLSSNLETVLANLIKKRENGEAIISNIMENSNRTYVTKVFNNLNRWVREVKDKTVWSNEKLFTDIIAKGTYPLHPITVWLLAYLSSWMQQRSTLSFVDEMFFDFNEQEVVDETLNYIYPTRIINSRIFNELYNAEEKGREQGQFCSTFNYVLNKYESYLSSDDIEVLRAILILQIGKFQLYDRLDNIDALYYCTGLPKKQIDISLNNLADNLGVIYFDDTLKKFNFLMEAAGKLAFNKEFFKKGMHINRDNILNSLDDEIKSQLGIGKVDQTPFGLIKNITTNEWSYNKSFIDISEFTDGYVRVLINIFKKAIHPDQPKGTVLWLYNDMKDKDAVDRTIRIFKTHKLNEMPILVFVINDVEGSIKESLTDIRILSKFTKEEQEKYSKYINKMYYNSSKKIINTFNKLALERLQITVNGCISNNRRLRDIETKQFEEVYTKTIPFRFDGFEKKVTTKVKKYYLNLCDSLIEDTITDISLYDNFPIDLRNRIDGLLKISNQNSWKVLLDNNVLTEPQNLNVNELYKDIMGKLTDNKKISSKDLFSYLYPPYGLNIYSLGAFLIYLSALHQDKIFFASEGKKTKLTAIKSEILDEKKDSIEKLLKLDMEYDDNVNVNALKQFADKCERNIYTENCEVLLKELNNIRDNEILTKDQSQYLRTIESQLTVGYNINQRIYSELNDQKRQYSDHLKNKFNPTKASSILKWAYSINSDMIPDTAFYYSPSYKEEVRILISRVIEALCEKISSFIDRLGRSIQLDKFIQYKKVFLNLSNLLIENNEITLSEVIKNSLASATKYIEKRKNDEKLLSEFHNEFIQCEAKRYNYEDITLSINMLDKWETFFNNGYIGEDIKKQDIEKINKLKKELDKIKSGVDTLLEVIIQIKDKLASIKDISLLKGKVNDLKAYNLSDINEKYVNSIDEACNRFNKDLEKLKSPKKSRSEIDSYYNQLKMKYSNTMFHNILINEMASYNRELDFLEESWCHKYIIDELIISSFSSVDCFKWINDTRELPYYLKDETIKAQEYLLQCVDKRIRECKIESIVSLFSELSADEKKNCINLLQSL